MGLEVATYIASLVSSNPVGGTDQKAQGDDHLRLLKAVLQSTFPNANKAFYFPQILSKSANYSLVVGDGSSLVFVDSTGASRTISLPNTGTIAAGWSTTIFKSVAANSVIIDTPGAETINGAATLTLTSQYSFATLEFDGTNWALLSFQSPLTTRGDLYLRDASGDSRLAIGTVRQLLSNNATDPAWISADLIASDTALVGGKLVWSVAASALTVAVKTLAGANPSASSPVFCRVSDGSGGFNWRSITAALSLVISSGSTLGTTNSTAFRVWIGLLDNGGTLELFAINCRSGTSVLALDEAETITTTAEGGAGGADTVQVPYSTTARANKQFRLVGYGTWNSGLATAGTWSAGPSVSVLRTLNTKLPGDLVQSIYFSDNATTSTSTELPIDDTIPQSGEGAQWTSQSITPKAAANILETSVAVQMGGQSTGAIALFQDATAGALAAACGTPSTTTPRTISLALQHRMLAGTTSATTLKVRFGGITGNTFAINGGNGGRIFGGVSQSSMLIRELQG